MSYITFRSLRKAKQALAVKKELEELSKLQLITTFTSKEQVKTYNTHIRGLTTKFNHLLGFKDERHKLVTEKNFPADIPQEHVTEFMDLYVNHQDDEYDF